MAIKRWLGTVSSLVLATLFASHGATAQNSKIGIASAVKNRVDGTTGGATRPLAPGSDIFAREVVRTGEQSTAQLLFLDETSLAIGPQSEVTLDRFVFDPNRGAGNVAINLGRGMLRFATGSQNPGSYRVTTPVATIGVRGTLFDLYSIQTRAGQWIQILILVQGALVGEIAGVKFELKTPGQAMIYSPPSPPRAITWDTSLFSVVSNLSFPLLGRNFIHRLVELPDGAIDRLDQILGSGGPPNINDGGDGGNQDGNISIF
jgi:hypothetical protein